MKLQYITLTAISFGILICQNDANAHCPPLREVNTVKAVNNLLAGHNTASGWFLEVVDTDKTDPVLPLTIGQPLQKQEKLCHDDLVRTITVTQVAQDPKCTYVVLCHPGDLEKPSNIVGRFTVEHAAINQPENK